MSVPSALAAPSPPQFPVHCCLSTCARVRLQHRETNTQLAQLAAVTSQLAASLQATSHLTAAARSSAAAGPAAVPSPAGSLAELLFSPSGTAVAAAGVVAAVLAGVVIGRVFVPGR